jgi:uncharacterized protein with HEPN domain
MIEAIMRIADYSRGLDFDQFVLEEKTRIQ